jgi:cytochrome P450
MDDLVLDPPRAADAEAEQLLADLMHSPDALQDPYPIVGHLFDSGDYFESSNGMTFVWAYGLANSMLRSREMLKYGYHGSMQFYNMTPAQEAELHASRPAQPGRLNTIDSPDHERLRRLISMAFTPKAVQGARDSIVIHLARILEELDPRGPVDLVSTLATTLPLQVIGELIGLELPDRQRFAEVSAVWSRAADPTTTWDEQLALGGNLVELRSMVSEVLARRRREPKDDLAGKLVELEQAGEVITQDEAVTLLHQMYTGGFATTRSMISNGIVALLAHPDQARSLRDDPALDRSATEEVLRWDAPIATATYVSDHNTGTEFDGITVDPKRPWTALLGAANHDPRVFADPDRFDVRRTTTSAPLTFGGGAHFCVGSALAKMEGDLVFSTLVRRFPEMEFAGRGAVRTKSFRMRGFDEITVTLGQPSPSR